MLSFQSLNLRSARLVSPYDKWTAKQEEERDDNDDDEVQDIGPIVRSCFGQRVLWIRYQQKKDNHGTTNTTTTTQQQHSPPLILGRHLTARELEPYRLVGDPMVDDLLQAMKDEGTPVGAGDDLLRYCQLQAAAAEINEKRNATTSTTTISSSTNNSSSRARRLAASFWNTYHFNQNNNNNDPSTSSSTQLLLPSWVNVDQLQRGQQVFLAYLPAMSYALYYRSFVPGFSIPKIAQVLKTTGYLAPTTNSSSNSNNSSNNNNKSRERVQERLMDTGAFLAACMGLDVSELLPGQAAWKCILQVRILHAKVRHALLQRKRRHDWQLDEWGVPINAEDMAATLLAFSTNAMMGVEFLMGFPLTPSEREDYLALWRYIGWLLGVTVNDNDHIDDDNNDNDEDPGTTGTSPPPPSTTTTTRLRPLDPCGPGWIVEHPNVIEHSDAMLQSIIFHILQPDQLSVTISHHLLRMRQPEQQQHTPSPSSNSAKNSDKNAQQQRSSKTINHNHEDSDNLWFFYRALQCRRFVGDPLADALQLPLHKSWWTRTSLFAASTVCLVLVRWYTRLALPWSPFRKYLIQYHQHGLRSFWNTWLETHPKRMTQALASTTVKDDASATELSTPGQGDYEDNNDEIEPSGQHACPFAMVAPPIY